MTHDDPKKLKDNDIVVPIHWEFGPCYGNFNYRERTEYTQRCCVKKAKHELTCYNTRFPDGWYEHRIEIQGHQYCDDFIGYKLIRDVQINGNKS